MTKIWIYTRPDCHLCEEASSLLRELDPDLHVEPVNIDDSVELLRRYGTRIPVLKREDNGRELDWPFDAGRLSGFIGNGE